LNYTRKERGKVTKWNSSRRRKEEKKKKKEGERG